jgi:hypothetical protein
MAKYTHIKQLLDFHGLDLRSSEMLRGRGFASDGTENVMHTPQGGITCRYGSKIVAPKIVGGGAGPWGGIQSFSTTDLTGVQKTELVGWRTNLYVMTRGSFTITNANASAATVNHYYDATAGAFLLTIARGGSTIYSGNLGLGTEASPVYLGAVETAVSAVSGLTMATVAGAQASTTPAAFMELLVNATIAGSGGTLTIYYYYWSEATQAGNGVSADSLAGSDAYRSTSSAVLNNVLYYTSAKAAGGSTDFHLMKYDGNRCYRAGLPNVLPTGTINITNSAGGAQTSDVRGDMSVFAASPTISGDHYVFRMVNIDKAGNRVESAVHRLSGTSSATAQVNLVSWSVPTTIGAFNTPFARTSSAQAGVLTIAVTSGHTMQAGDIAYFYDSSQSRFIQRLVTATTSTTITVSTTSLDPDTSSINYDDGGVVSVQNDALITNNFRIAIYRRVSTGGSTYYLVAEVPSWLADATVSTQFKYADNTEDADLSASGAALVEDEFPHDQPPGNCAHVSTYNGGLILSGNTLKPNRVFFSDVDGPEYFPAVTHNFDVVAPVTGHHQTGESLAIGTLNSLHVTSGVLSEFQFRVDQIGTNVGVTSHLSMQEVDEGVLCFSSGVGPYVLFSGRRLEPLGPLTYPDGAKVSRLEPYWTRRYTTTEAQPVFKRAIAAVLPKDKLYVLWVPTEDPAYPGFASAGKVFVFDYGRGVWWPWTGLNMAGGITVQDDVLYWQSLYHEAGTERSHAYQQQRSTSLAQYVFADHNAAISFKHRAHWESLGQPALYKRPLRCRVSFHETAYVSTTTLDVNTYVDYGTTQSNDDTLTVLSTTKDLRPKLKAETCRAIMVEFAATVRYNPPPPISGYELEMVANFRPEMKE